MTQADGRFGYALLLEKGAGSKAKDEYGQTLLSHAARGRHKGGVNILLGNSAEKAANNFNWE